MQISQEMADHFEKAQDVPGSCTLTIQIQDDYGEDDEMRQKHNLEEQPMFELSGIDSDKKYIRIDPPIGSNIDHMTQGMGIIMIIIIMNTCM